ncbi:MAG: ABC transporter permease, partial [Saprospiraceae bacterium]
QTIRLRKENKEESQGLLKVLWKGRTTSYVSIPVRDIKIAADTLRYQPFFDPADYRYQPDLPVAKIAMSQLEIDKHGSPVFTRSFPFGTDIFGRCIFSRMILGIRISLFVGLIAVSISLTLGIALGSIAAYFGGIYDHLISLVSNTLWSIPTLLFIFAIVMALGRGVGVIFFAVGLTMWVDVARLVRGQVLGLKQQEFILAGKTLGFQHSRIIMRHILPNILGPVMVMAAANFAQAILLEAGLSYLGFGIQAPTPSLGNILNENYGYALNGKPWLGIIPASAILLLVLAFNLLGNGLRDALDVKQNIQG